MLILTLLISRDDFHVLLIPYDIVLSVTRQKCSAQKRADNTPNTRSQKKNK